MSLLLAAQTSEEALDVCSEGTWFEFRLEDQFLWLRVCVFRQANGALVIRLGQDGHFKLPCNSLFSSHPIIDDF